MDLFAPVRQLDARALAGPTVEVQARPGTALAREGELLGTFFVIRAGTAEVTRAGSRLRTLGAGDCFGEIDSVPALPQRQSVTAISEMRLLAFSSLGIDRLCASVPSLRERLAAVVAP